MKNGSTLQPDEFFRIFGTFLNSLNDARIENERIKKQKEEEEKRAQLEEKVNLENHLFLVTKLN